MDINQSPLSRYKSNRTGTSRSASDAKAMAEAAKTKEASGSSSAQNTKSIELKEGQIVKGQIIDHRYNEVKIQLEPGKQIVSARLSGDVPLSIGQEAKFVVSSESTDQLVLKYIPQDTAAPADTAVLKALAASGLPMTDRNKALVTELLNQRMPVDKQTLQYIIKMSVTNREASPQTLVLMMKNNIPMTPENIRQFEAYQNGTHQLLDDIQSIAKEATELLSNHQASRTDLPINNLMSEQSANNLPLSVGQNNTLKALPKINANLIDILNSTIVSDENSAMPLKSILGPEELTLLSKTIEQKMNGNPVLVSELPSDILSQIESGTLSLSNSLKLITELFLNDPQTTPQQLQESLPQILQQNQIAPSVAQILTKLTDQSLLPADHSPTLSAVLNSSDRAMLVSYLSSMPDADGRYDRISQGTVSLKETLSYIQESLLKSDDTSSLKLLQSPVYSKLLQEAFLQKWTISPKEVAKKEPVQELYRQLSDDIDKINTLIKSEKSAENIQRLQEPVKNLQENMQFMKDLNGLYTYLQLPVQFRDREVHTDLYVLTRKKALNDKRENLSVLLHLDMTNLGSLNVHIQMKNNQIQADFYTENPEAGRLIKDNLPQLTQALTDKGYTIKADVKDNYKKPDFCKDFIEQNSSDHYVQRYTFDIRT